MGTHVLQLKKMSYFARKPSNINVLGSAAQKLALVPVSRYNFDVMLMSVPSFIRIERGSDVGPWPQTKQLTSFCSNWQILMFTAM